MEGMFIPVSRELSQRNLANLDRFRKWVQRLEAELTPQEALRFDPTDRALPIDAKAPPR